MIYDSNQETAILSIDIIQDGYFKYITNLDEGRLYPCFIGKIGSTNNKQIGRGWTIAFANCHLNALNNSFQANYFIWNPISTINYAGANGAISIVKQ